MRRLHIRDFPEQRREELSVYGIEFAQQRTGFGFKWFFLCPRCGSRRVDLYQHDGNIYCRSCLPFNIYRARCNMYDEGGTDLIVWHMRKLAKSISDIPIKWPFCYLQYALNRPKHMREERFRTVLLKLQMLENMRFCAIVAGKQFTATDIRRYTADDFVNLFNLWQIKEYLLFHGKCNPRDYAAILPKGPDA